MKSFYPTILKNIILPIADKAMKTNIHASFQLIKRLRDYSKEDIVKWQNERLVKLVDYAYNNSRFYKNIFDDRNIKPNDVQTISDLEKIPVLTKAIIRENVGDIMSINISKIPHKNSATGGSTGEPLKYYLDNKSWSFSNANYVYNWERCDYRYGQKYIALGSTSLFINSGISIRHRIYYHLKGKIGLSGISMSANICKEYILIIKKRKIDFLYGYASSIYLLAKFALKANIRIHLKACFSTSEVLTDLYYNTIREAFNCDILDCYSSNDGGVNAFSKNRALYEVGYNCIVRTETKGKVNKGPALLTDLFNYAMPLINYSNGDEIVLSSTYSDYNGQVLSKIEGRTSDIIELENGNVITGPGFTILFKDIPVEHYFVEKVGLNSIECNIVKLPEYTEEHEELIVSTLKKQMGNDVKIELNYTDYIPLTKSGKRLYFRNSKNTI